MNNKALLAVLVIGCMGVFIIVSKSGVLSRFNTISANCQLSGLGTLRVRYQYSSTNELMSVNLNGLEIDRLQVVLSKSALNIYDEDHSIKIDLKNKKVFTTLNRKSFSGKCSIDNFKM
jgi:hypothetical protein